MKIGDEIYVHGFIDEIRKDIIIIHNEGGYFGTIPEEIQPHLMKIGKWIYKSNSYAYGVPEYECDQCGYGVREHAKSKYCPECGARMVQDD